jgi:hypothetical protein
VKLINTDGLALIGPGSEWFWTAISGLVLAVTFLAIYRQLRLQSSAGAIEQATALARGWNSELLHRSRLAVLLALRDGVDQPTPPIRHQWRSATSGSALLGLSGRGTSTNGLCTLPWQHRPLVVDLADSLHA